MWIRFIQFWMHILTRLLIRSKYTLPLTMPLITNMGRAGLLKNNQRKTDYKVSRIWTKYYALIIDEVNIVKIDMLLNITKQLAKVSSLTESSTAIFGELPIVILIREFY